MSINPDTDAIYAEAIEMRARVEKFELRRQEFARLVRDKIMTLLAGGEFLPRADVQIRLEVARIRAEQLIEESHSELVKRIEEESAAFAAIRARNEGIVAAGWAKMLTRNPLIYHLQEQEYNPPQDSEGGES